MAPDPSAGAWLRPRRRRTGRRVRRLLVGFLGICALFAMVGIVGLGQGNDARTVNPDAGQFLADGASIEVATVGQVKAQDCNADPASADQSGSAPAPTTATNSAKPQCALVLARVRSGRYAGATTQVEVGREVRKAGLRVGDRVQLLRTPAPGGQPASYPFFDFDRKLPLVVLALAFA